MSDPKGKALPNLLTLYFIMLIIYCLDVFFLKSDLTVLGDNFYARFISFVVLFMTLLFKKEHLKNFGISKKKENFIAAVKYGTFFSVVPLLIVSAVELIVFKFSNPSAIDLRFSPPSLSYVRTEGYLTPAFCITVYILTTLFAACFKEMFFRGLLIHKLEKLTVFKSANIFQALLYMTFILPKLIRNFAKNYYSKEIVDLALFVVLFYIIHEFITGIKWGLLAKASGTTYISIVDNFLYVFLANSVRVVDQSTKWLFMIHMLCTQLISLALVYIYYKKSMAKSSVVSETAATAEKDTKKTEEEKGYSAEIISDAEEISPDQFKDIVRENSADNDKKSHNGDMSETEIDNFLKDFGKPHHHYRPPVQVQPTAKKEDENFDVDEFLKGYENK
ncbi:MAG TPA: hypothetical protein DCS04_00360 [Ruminococcaceae bacterium]|nr:hypothetical protein [Oscillospiraceae bacterium]